MSGSGSSHGHGTQQILVTGLSLAFGLTVIPFLIVATGMFETETALFAIALLAVIQVVVHLVYFLHLDFTKKGGWTLLSFVFTITVVALFVGGSLWIMYHLNTNMMPPDMMVDHMMKENMR
ncbi:cytochrome o ubiquinol oxidase subunit IV (plasmid) [Paroceanicella profunda]|uniref:Cytochrome bo(3) ubiquinol oxidase subunit 4 n=1 Tax=Paroceanicella profunda TaxID=2579971 RepID=A0A5B8G5S5_9RHOB|nr:cytochrome o ubiquinol oxidase subunit IV [Paroceanicella profunda]QDL94383.1 cytochrome o ubiquinol oxidase subunit IV [Paroceanicella profunda]